MNWAVQVILQGIFVALAAVIALWLPWLWVRTLAGITLIYFLLRIGQNPMGFWRRLSRMVVIAAIPATI